MDQRQSKKRRLTREGYEIDGFVVENEKDREKEPDDGFETDGTWEPDDDEEETDDDDFSTDESDKNDDDDP